MDAEGHIDKPPPPPPPDPPPDYSAVNEPTTDSAGSSARVDQQASPEQVSDTAEIAAAGAPDYSAVNEPITDSSGSTIPIDRPGAPEQVSGTVETMAEQPPDYSAVNEPITDSSGSTAPTDHVASPEQISETAETSAAGAPDYSAVNEPITDSVDSSAPIDQQATPEIVRETAETATTGAAGYSAVKEPIRDNNSDGEFVESLDTQGAPATVNEPDAASNANTDQAGEQSAAPSDSEAAARSDAMDRQLQENADFFDSEAARYRELGDDDAANASQQSADAARSLIDPGQPNGPDARESPTDNEPDTAGNANTDQAREQSAAPSDSEAAARSDAMDRQLQENADFFDSEAARYRELGDDDAANASQQSADAARLLIDTGQPNRPDARESPTDLGHDKNLSFIERKPISANADPMGRSAFEQLTGQETQHTDGLFDSRDTASSVESAGDPTIDTQPELADVNSFKVRNGVPGEYTNLPNCTACAKAVDARLAGHDAAASAGFMAAGASEADLESEWGTSIERGNWSEIDATLAEAGPGSRGILTIEGEKGAHVANVLNRDGNCVILDGQVGREYENVNEYLGDIGFRGAQLGLVRTY